MKKIGSNLKKIFAATSVSIFSLVVCFAGVYAWFTTNTHVDSTSDNFKVFASDCEIAEFNLYKFEYGSSTYEGFTITEFIDLTKGKVVKYSYNESSGDFVDTLSNTVTKMNTYDPVEIVYLGSNLYKLHCNVVFEIKLHSKSFSNTKMLLKAIRDTEKSVSTNQILLSSCADFDVFFAGDIADSNFTANEYYPYDFDVTHSTDYLNAETKLKDAADLYYKISYLCDKKSDDNGNEHSHYGLAKHFYGDGSLPDNLTLVSKSDPGVTFEDEYLTFYINVNYAPSQLEDYTTQIYSRSIEAVYDFNFDVSF